MAHLDNPAGRVQAIIERASDKVQSDIPARDGWQHAFEVEDFSQLPKAFAEFITQVNLARETISGLPEDEEDPAHLLEYFPALDSICQNLLVVGTTNMSHFKPWITPALVHSLGSCSAAIRRNGGREVTIDRQGIADMLELVSMIRGECLESEIPLDVKELILRRLLDIELALASFNMSGFSAVEKALDAFIGTAAREQAKPGVVERCGKWIAQLWTKIGSVSKGATEIAESAQKVSDAYAAITGG